MKSSFLFIVNKDVTETLFLSLNFLDFASSSFDAILFPNSTIDVTTNDKNDPKKRETHLPDLIPFIQLITDKCDIQPVLMVIALMYVQRFRKALPAGNLIYTS